MRDIKRARKILQQAALKEFPNPERIGCPPEEALEAMARYKRSATEADLHHITHCSPCFASFLATRRNARKQYIVRAAIAFACAVVLAAGIYFAVRPQARYRAMPVIAQWNLENASPLRGAEVRRQVTVEAPRQRGTVIVRLPFGSDDGRYDVEIRRSPSAASPIKNFHGVAAIQNGYTILRVQMDFSTLSSGKYTVAYRHADASWHFVQLVVP
ncbi:MAG: hypothetical protein ACRD6B_21300 [Bryobacteraceae bacterium]